MDKPTSAPDLGTLRALVARQMHKLMADQAYLQFFFDADTLYDLGLTGGPEDPITQGTVIDVRDGRQFRVSDLFDPSSWSFSPRNSHADVDPDLPDNATGEPEPSLSGEGWMIRLSSLFAPQASRLTAFVNLDAQGLPQDDVDFELD
jgi:hypothetical protein